MATQQTLPPRGSPEHLRQAAFWTTKSAIRLAALACIGHVILALFSWVSPAVELMTHFSMHAFFGFCVILAALCVLRDWLFLILAAPFWLYLGSLVQPWGLLPYQPEVPPPGSKQSYKVLSWNVLASNEVFEEVAEVIEEENPDILILLEVRPDFLQQMPSLKRRYPNQLVYEKWGGNGIALFTRQTNVNLRLADFDFRHQPAIIATFPANAANAPVAEHESHNSDVSGGVTVTDNSLQLVAMHTLSPIPVSRTKFRDQQLAAVARWVDEQSGPVCLAGDLNITPWAAAFRNLIRAGFRDSRLGAGNCASWPSDLGMLGIPIDHALSHGGCTITNRRVLPVSAGSDHRPITFQLSF